MNVNQQPHMASPYGQPQPGYQGYSQSGYGGQQMPGGYAAPYAPYNGPASNYQTGPPQGNCKYADWLHMNNNQYWNGSYIQFVCLNIHMILN